MACWEMTSTMEEKREGGQRGRRGPEGEQERGGLRGTGPAGLPRGEEAAKSSGACLQGPSERIAGQHPEGVDSRSVAPPRVTGGPPEDGPFRDTVPLVPACSQLELGEKTGRVSLSCCSGGASSVTGQVSVAS